MNINNHKNIIIKYIYFNKYNLLKASLLSKIILTIDYFPDIVIFNIEICIYIYIYIYIYIDSIIK